MHDNVCLFVGWLSIFTLVLMVMSIIVILVVVFVIALMLLSVCGRGKNAVLARGHVRQLMYEGDDVPNLFIVVGLSPRGHARHLDPMFDGPKRDSRIDDLLRKIRRRWREARANLTYGDPRRKMTVHTHGAVVLRTLAHSLRVIEWRHPDTLCAAQDRMLAHHIEERAHRSQMRPIRADVIGAGECE